jgi:hypothetical protein
MRRQIISLLAAAIISGCSTIEHTSSTEQPTGKPTIAGVGDVVLHVNKQRNLENAFGKSDIFGRKTNEGFSELRFAGVEKSGEIVLYRKDVSIITNETTMSRTPFSTTSGSASTNVSGDYYGDKNNSNSNINGNATTNYSSTTLTPVSDFHIIVPVDTIPIRLSPNETKIPMDGYVVEILKAAPNSLEYIITKS